MTHKNRRVLYVGPEKGYKYQFQPLLERLERKILSDGAHTPEDAISLLTRPIYDMILVVVNNETKPVYAHLNGNNTIFAVNTQRRDYRQITSLPRGRTVLFRNGEQIPRTLAQIVYAELKGRK